VTLLSWLELSFPDESSDFPGMVRPLDEGLDLPGGGFSREDLKSEFFISVEDVEGVVQVSANNEMLSGPRQGVGPFQDLDVDGIERDGEVVAEIAIGLEAKDGVELKILGEGPVDVRQAIRWLSKTHVVLLEVPALQKTVGGSDGGDSFTPEGLDKPILMCAIAPFDTPFGLC
jgi:hypothetical protein